VAGQGGASRAAFFTASVIGELLDRTHESESYADFGDRLFAISSVSGSSLGAVVDRAALEEVTPRTMKVVDDVASGDLRKRLRGLRKGGLA
jgi:hypothetical protein